MRETRWRHSFCREDRLPAIHGSSTEGGEDTRIGQRSVCSSYLPIFPFRTREYSPTDRHPPRFPSLLPGSGAVDRPGTAGPAAEDGEIHRGRSSWYYETAGLGGAIFTRETNSPQRSEAGGGFPPPGNGHVSSVVEYPVRVGGAQRPSAPGGLRLRSSPAVGRPAAEVSPSQNVRAKTPARHGLDGSFVRL